MHLQSAILRLTDLASVVEALVDDVDSDRMLLLLSQLRAQGRVVTLDTSPAAMSALAATLELSEDELLHAFDQAPDDKRERFRDALQDPQHHGCEHLQAQLEDGRHAAPLLEAFVTACWYGWPGLRLQISQGMAGYCCCGIELTPTRLPSAYAGMRPMTAVDI